MKKIQIICRVRNNVPTGYIDTIEVNDGYVVNEALSMYRHPKSKTLYVIDNKTGLSIDRTHLTFKSILEDKDQLLSTLNDFIRGNERSYAKMVYDFEELKGRCKYEK